MKIKIDGLDPNMQQQSALGLEKLQYHHYLCGDFTVSGAAGYNESSGNLIRVPLEVLNRARERSGNDGVYNLAHCQAGVRLRFCTDSPFLAVKNITEEKDVYGYLNYDLYQRVGNTFRHITGRLCAPGNKGTFEALAFDRHTPVSPMTEYELYFPILTPISALYIGLREGARILPPTDYVIQQPIVFYGSSITHGACALRPGNAYNAMISRRLCADYINLGFSGNAKGEPEMAEYIAGLSMSAFVLDYDHNAPNPAHLEQTHEPFFKTVRERQPDLPIVMVSRLNTQNNSLEDALRREIVWNTYLNARRAGDENVYLVDGSTFLLNDYADADLSDGCHPNDAGFVQMAERIGGVLRRAIRME